MTSVATSPARSTGSRRVDATPADEGRQRWRTRPLPRLRRQARVSISASPLRTDSGSLLFEVRVRPR